VPPAVAKILTELALDREFDYLVPAELAAQVRIGSVVRVPFGRRRARGFVIGFAEKSAFPNLKAIESVASDLPLFDEPMLRLARLDRRLLRGAVRERHRRRPARRRAPAYGAKFKEQLVAAVRAEAAPTAEEEGRAGEEKPQAGRRLGAAAGVAAKRTAPRWRRQPAFRSTVSAAWRKRLDRAGKKA
jgi:primosomal protein N' (replication factor Y)